VPFPQCSSYIKSFKNLHSYCHYWLQSCVCKNSKYMHICVICRHILFFRLFFVRRLYSLYYLCENFVFYEWTCDDLRVIKTLPVQFFPENVKNCQTHEIRMKQRNHVHTIYIYLFMICKYSWQNAIYVYALCILYMYTLCSYHMY